MDVTQQNQIIGEAAAYIEKRLPPADVAVVLGSGLGSLAELAQDSCQISYGDIPHFPAPTVLGHSGQLFSGRVGQRQVYMLSGRFHYYEGHDPQTVILPMRVLQRLGCTTVILTNAAGGVNTALTPGDLMLITDHINLTGYNPLRGANDEQWGPRFPDMSRAYDPDYRRLALSVAKDSGIDLRQGVYLGLSGPNFETPAEIRMARLLGADAVGMSTVPEVLAAVQEGLRVLAISCITNMAAGILPQPLTHAEVFATGKRCEETFTRLVTGIIHAL